ncbi:MAG: DNA replication/repair protein RecF [Gammaproteobacteria bacterium]|nr:DNA replication/repair protein RecF [Gammaproteobacteria bacterium]
MTLKRLEISYFRNLEAVSLDLAPGLNFFYGPNGAGKTAILEATYFLARARSFRSAQPRSYIQHGAETLTVRGLVEDRAGGSQALALSKTLAGASLLRINGVTERKMSKAAGLLPVQVMLPDVGQLVFGGPLERRRWLDWGVFHVEPRYLDSLRGFNRVLKQRNAHLKDSRLRGAPDLGNDPWRDQFVARSLEITESRCRYLAALSPIFAETLDAIAPDIRVRLSYFSGWPDNESLNKVLGDIASREVKLGMSMAGPHRADLELKIGISSNHEAKASAELSRGQGKALASALKIAQATRLSALAEKSSLLLIDDVGAELDELHNTRFFEQLKSARCQVLASSTRPPGEILRHFPSEDVKVFHVERGKINGESDDR